MHIGLIGGIGPAATDFYYRKLIEAFAKRSRDLDLTIVHADTPTLLGNLASGNSNAQIEIYRRLTDRLVATGAKCVVVTSIAGHFCIEPFKQQSPLPVIDLLGEVNAAVERRGLKRVGIIGTRTVMKTRFYGGLKTAEVVPPDGDRLNQVHDDYVAMAATGRATPEQTAVFDSACADLMNKAGAEAIMLGGTDLALVYDEASASIPLVDCASIHVQAIVRIAAQDG